MFWSFGPAAVLFLVAWHVATYLSVQMAEVSVAFFEWMDWLGGKRFIRRITIGLTVSGIILSTLHQGALGALFNYAPGKVHPLWYSASFQWIHFFVSAIPSRALHGDCGQHHHQEDHGLALRRRLSR